MASLQRSSVSFRRQGSSGRIWNDLHILDPKTGIAVPTATCVKQGDNKHLPNIDTNGEGNLHQNNHIDSYSPGTPIPPSPSENEAVSDKKVQGCGFSALFGRCSRG
ncbi:uncharacterized protein LOC123224871 [Mangifera indica]|uniref:uncharacterized protein LOC123224871 n=1 Tax=Mangifera indica TaxID=29780 RepID=UPI001CFA6B7F|nr:uncharacterized protein LOC123224871 [Mangifera indica]